VAYSSADPAVNPLMHSWNQVYIRYCDGGTFSGAATHAVNASFHLRFQGKAILEAMVAELRNFHWLGAAKQVVIGGSSAGGLAVYLHTDWWASQLPRDTTVAGLADSGFFADWSSTRPTQATHEYDEDIRSSFKLMNCSGGVNQNCVAAARADRRPLADCYFANNTLPHVSTPIFVLQSVYDSWQLQVMCCSLMCTCCCCCLCCCCCCLY